MIKGYWVFWNVGGINPKYVCLVIMLLSRIMDCLSTLAQILRRHKKCDEVGGNRIRTSTEREDFYSESLILFFLLFETIWNVNENVFIKHNNIIPEQKRNFFYLYVRNVISN